VLSSEVEGMPNALMEAMSLELSCISTQVGAVPELITNNFNGFIVPKRDYKELGEKIWQLLNSEDLQSRFGKNARKTMESRFTWERNVQLVEKCYLSIINH